MAERGFKVSDSTVSEALAPDWRVVGIKGDTRERVLTELEAVLEGES